MKGKAMLLLLPTEKPMVGALEQRSIKLLQTNIAADKMKPIAPLLQSLCASDTELKYLAQKCFTSYMRSVYLQANKAIFKFEALPSNEYALALGLPSAPKIKFVQKKKVKSHGPAEAEAEAEAEGGWGATSVKGKGKGKAKVPPAEQEDSDTTGDSDDEDDEHGDGGFDEAGGSADAGAAVISNGNDSSDDSEEDEDEEDDHDEEDRVLKPARNANQMDAMRKRKNADVLAPHRAAMRADQDDEDEDDFLVKSSTQRHATLEELDEDHATKKPANKKQLNRAVTVAALKKADLNPNDRKHLVFSEDGTAVNERTRLVGVDTADLPAIREKLAQQHHDLEEAARALQKEDIVDRVVDKERLRSKKLKSKLKRKADAQLDNAGSDDEGSGGFAVLGGGDGSDYEDGSESGSGSDDGDEPNLQDDQDVAMRLLGM
jgi:ATP-dependent RNA helicase DDX10/DBP4